MPCLSTKMADSALCQCTALIWNLWLSQTFIHYINFICFSWGCTRKLDGPINWNQGIMDAAADCNTLIDVFIQHFEKNFWLSCVFLQDISRNTSFTLLKYQNGWFSIMSTYGCNLKFVIISHIYMLFQCCLFNLSAFCAVVLEFWRKKKPKRS